MHEHADWQLVVNGLLGACVIILALESLSTRKALKHMSASFDALNTAIGTLETTTQAVVAALQQQQTGTSDSALDPLTARVTAAVATLNGAIPPKA